MEVIAQLKTERTWGRGRYALSRQGSSAEARLIHETAGLILTASIASDGEWLIKIQEGGWLREICGYPGCSQFDVK